MKPWEHPKVREALNKLDKIREEERIMNTPQGKKRFKVTYYIDPDGNKIIEIRGLETDDYILIPEVTLKQILKEVRERRGSKYNHK